VADDLRSSVKRKYRHTNHPKQEANVKYDTKPFPKVGRRKNIRRWMTPLWILSGLAFGLAGVLCAISVHHYKFPALWIAFGGTVLAVAAVFIWLHATIAQHDEDTSLPRPLDMSAPRALSEPKTASPTVPLPTLRPSPAAIITPIPLAPPTSTSPPPTPTPTPTPPSKPTTASTPIPEVKSDTPHEDAITPEEVSKKLKEAHEQARILEVRQALVDVPFDGKLLYWSAEFTEDNQVSAFFIFRSVEKDETKTDLTVSFLLPKKGHERLPLTDRYVAFRTEGVITEVTAADVVHLKNVRLKKVNPSTESSPPLPLITPKHRVESLSIRDVYDKLSEAIDSSERNKYHEVQNALIGLRVDWTLKFFSASRDPSGKLMQVTLYDPERMIVGLVWIKLPLAGNERLPLMEQTDVFRVRGIIDNPRIVGIDLRDATLEYVRSDAKT
jgi:hypothetical protein